MDDMLRTLWPVWPLGEKDMFAEECREKIHEIAKKSEIKKADAQEIMRAQARADFLDFDNLLDVLGVEGAKKVQGRLSAALTMRAAYALSDEFPNQPKPPEPGRPPPKPRGQDYLKVIKKVEKPRFIEVIDGMFALGYSFDPFLEELVETVDEDDPDSGSIQAKASDKIIRMMCALTTDDGSHIDKCSRSIVLNLLEFGQLSMQDCRLALGDKSITPSGKAITCYHTIRNAYTTQVATTRTMLRVLNIVQVSGYGAKRTLTLNDNKIVNRLKDVFRLPKPSSGA
jgi:hypothetical protein